MKNILLPTDFSENSRNAINYTFRFFKGQTCTFYFLNVQKVSEFTTDEIFAASGNTSLYDAIINDNKQKLIEFVGGFEKEYGSSVFSFKIIVDYDVFADAINQAVEAKKINLIVMGSNGVTGAKELIFGSNTLTVIRKVDCPLLVIPEDYSFKQLDSVLFTIHDQEKINSSKVTPLIKILKKHKSKLKILEIIEKNKVSGIDKEEIKKLFLPVTTNFYSLVEIPTPFAISAFVQLNEVQMHATFIERKSFIERFIFGSETSTISYETKMPLLILHR